MPIPEKNEKIEILFRIRDTFLFNSHKRQQPPFMINMGIVVYNLSKN